MTIHRGDDEHILTTATIQVMEPGSASLSPAFAKFSRDLLRKEKLEWRLVSANGGLKVTTHVFGHDYTFEEVRFEKKVAMKGLASNFGGIETVSVDLTKSDQQSLKAEVLSVLSNNSPFRLPIGIVNFVVQYDGINVGTLTSQKPIILELGRTSSPMLFQMDDLSSRTGALQKSSSMISSLLAARQVTLSCKAAQNNASSVSYLGPAFEGLVFPYPIVLPFKDLISEIHVSELRLAFNSRHQDTIQAVFDLAARFMFPFGRVSPMRLRSVGLEGQLLKLPAAILDRSGNRMVPDDPPRLWGSFQLPAREIDSGFMLSFFAFVHSSFCSQIATSITIHTFRQSIHVSTSISLFIVIDSMKGNIFFHSDTTLRVINRRVLGAAMGAFINETKHHTLVQVQTFTQKCKFPNFLSAMRV